MKEIVDFLIKVNKLKEMPRSGWVLMEVEEPETVAEHLFGLAILSFLLAKKGNLNIKRAIEVAIFHELCEVYAGDVTPFFYYPYLPKSREKRKKMLMRWARLSQREKEKIGKKKFKRESDCLLRLIKFLKPNLKNKILFSWSDYEKGITKEGKFVRQLNRIETLIQSIKFFGVEDVEVRTNWWEWTEEIAEDPLLLKFLKTIQKKFYNKVIGGYKKNEELENILDFILEVGNLKKMPRLYWRANGIKNPETLAGHIFSVALGAWVLGEEKRQLDMGKLLKMALCHELSAVFTGDTIPYIKRLPKDPKERREILKKWPRLPKKEKTKRFLREYKEEKKAFQKLTKNLKKDLKEEIIGLWDEYRMRKNPEAVFLSQVNILMILLQGLLYQKRYRDYLTDPLWEWAFERCDDQIALEFLDALKEKFY